MDDEGSTHAGNASSGKPVSLPGRWTVYTAPVPARPLSSTTRLP
ncbi:MAG: hypothetical protein ACRDS0_34815 [Pseudonocardiaceae bacterium]